MGAQISRPREARRRRRQIIIIIIIVICSSHFFTQLATLRPAQ